MKDVGYRKIYGIIESGLLDRVTKRSIEDNNQYVDIIDFEEFELSPDEEEFLVDCLRQLEIEVYDRYGNIYGENNDENIVDLSVYYMINKYRNGDHSYIETIMKNSFDIVDRVVKQLEKKYELNQNQLQSIGCEYVLYLIDECPLDKVNSLFDNLEYGIASYIINEIISDYKGDGKTNKLIEEYLDIVKEFEKEEKAISLLAKQYNMVDTVVVNNEPVNTNNDSTYNRFNEFGMSLSDAISLLSVREQRVISLRLGLTGKYYSQEEIAKELGRTAGYVNKVEKNAMEKLKGLVVKEIYDQLVEDLYVNNNEKSGKKR